MRPMMLMLAAALIVTTLAIHSILGERRLIGPMLADRSGVLANALARAVVRFAWHLTSAIGLIVAISLVAVALHPTSVSAVLTLATAVVFITAGLIDAIASRGRHVGWPLLVLIGLAALLAAFLD